MISASPIQIIFVYIANYNFTRLLCLLFWIPHFAILSIMHYAQSTMCYHLKYKNGLWGCLVGHHATCCSWGSKLLYVLSIENLLRSTWGSHPWGTYLLNWIIFLTIDVVVVGILISNPDLFFMQYTWTHYIHKWSFAFSMAHNCFITVAVFQTTKFLRLIPSTSRAVNKMSRLVKKHGKHEPQLSKSRAKSSWLVNFTS